ncbi:probable serine/threonine-protein kinase DDB_G0271402 [Dysidea avara]|uniref:probable serine/threonine-protein kinase DDB_G0271402 n=1 Tax=Dysidea avara TaxID=196820 RepID=UPI00332F4BD2
MATRVATDLTLYDVNPTGKEIGRGAYGRVFEVDYQGTLCAAKEVHSVLLEWSQTEGRRKITTDFLNECQIWSTIRHPCVVQFLGVYYPARDQYRLPVMVMEKMQLSLRGLVENYNNIPLNVKLSILDEVCLGLRYLHSRNPPIVHCDLTPNNILLGRSLEAKITDLGVAKVMQTDSKMTMTKFPGTPDFMPPEALTKRPVYGPPLDVFSYGGVALIVITQQWPELTDREQLSRNTDRWEVVSEVMRRQKYLNMFTGGAADLVSLVTSCLSDNPEKRPSVLEVSMEIKRVKDVCSHQTGCEGMSPIVWWAEVSGQSSQQEQMVQSPTPDLFSGPVNIKWQDGAPAPVKRGHHTAVLCDGKVYSGGGNETGGYSYRIDVYNPINNSWSPSPINTPYSSFAMTTLNNQLITAGGCDRSDKVTNKILSLDGDHLKEYTRMTTPRHSATAVGHQGTLIITGGKDYLYRRLATTELFDSTTGQWYTTSDLPLPHSRQKSVIKDNTLYLLGGVYKDGNMSPAVFTAPLDTLSSHQLKWSSQQDTSWCYSTPVSIQGRHLLTLGGVKETGSGYVYTSDINIFNKVSHSWEVIGQLPSVRSEPAVISVADNKIVVVGGYDDDKVQFTNTVWIGSCEPQ